MDISMRLILAFKNSLVILLTSIGTLLTASFSLLSIAVGFSLIYLAALISMGYRIRS